ncbi:unnamed protein product [Hydatigera taeniaeformis]|uniref:Uncharacterized protein n=1 Tax=Hydatigena taeniaeformis TaxID=6205 RepID=A0A0R3X1X2_HYDTA|nr:unnamed protein product [Hydatigera taeniaeformis]
MAFVPILKMKMDELFIRWLTDEVAQAGLKQSLLFLKSNDRLEASRAICRIIVPSPLAQPSHSSDAWHSSPSFCSPCASPRPLTPPHYPTAHRSSHDRQLQSPRRSPLPCPSKFAVRPPLHYAGFLLSYLLYIFDPSCR